ncbi:MAG: aldehyde dehydrogenase family protein [Akkermansiaceae bacterium]|nr:aldehyde dehydrogenase family protein [Akkermansiaceae bacterium]MCP5543275.1 aldehyde dehydrogenase family protein [Akkermansiaceae bacterium]
MEMNAESIVRRQREFFRSGATLPEDFRRDALETLLSMLSQHEGELLDALRQDLGKSPHQAFATEIGFLGTEIRHALRKLRKWMKPGRPHAPWIAWPSRAEVRSEPFGVALILGPWNYPLQLVLSPLVGAIAAGNCVVLKPSEAAPHTSELLERLIAARFDPGFLTVATGGRETAEILLTERFDKIFLTGGAAAGHAVMGAAARHLTPVTLELGGKCPCIVEPGVPLETTARRIVWGKFLNAGQTCVAPDHVWVHHEITGELVEAMRRAITEFFGENPQRSPDFGRIINAFHHDRLTGLLGDVSIACGGRADREDLYLEPTILLDPVPGSAVMSEEIFGPILPVLSYQKLDDVLSDLRGKPTPLAVYLFSDDRETQRRVVSETRSGGVCINDTILQILRNDLPLGGLGASGFGSYRGHAGFRCFSHQRTVLTRRFRPDPGFRYPPVTIGLETLRRLMRWMR